MRNKLTNSRTFLRLDQKVVYAFIFANEDFIFIDEGLRSFVVQINAF